MPDQVRHDDLSAATGAFLIDQSRFRGGAHWLALLAIVAAGAVLRTVAIGREALWSDEALTLVLAHWPVGEMILQPADQTPFLYYTLHKLLFTAADSAATVRTLSLAAGLLAIPLIYAAARLCFGRGAGLLAAALLAVWGPHIDYSQEDRAYALLFLLTLASATSLLAWFREAMHEESRPRLRYLALAAFAVTTALSFYAHLTSIFWIAAALQIFVSLTLRTPARRYRAEAAAALAAMALLAAPGLVRLARVVSTPDTFHWLSQASPARFIRTSADILLPLGTGAAQPLLQIAAAAALAMLLIRGRSALAPLLSRNPAAPAVILALLALPLVVWLAGFLLRPLFMPRTALYGAPGAILLIAGAVQLLPRHRAATAALVTALALSQPLLAGTVREKEDWRGAFAALAARTKAGDLIVTCPAWKYPALRHAIAHPLPAPVVVNFADPLLLEGRLGMGTHWDRTFFAAVTAPSGRALMYRRPFGIYPPARLRLAKASRVWLVASECSPEEKWNVAAWFGRTGPWTTVWRAPARADHAGIDLIGFVPAGTGTLNLRLPPRTDKERRSD
jgi:mannosyltransferase